MLAACLCPSQQHEPAASVAETSRRVASVLERLGFAVHHVSGSHYVLKHSEKTHLRVTLPWHGKDLRPGTLRSIIEQAGLTVSEFGELL